MLKLALISPKGNFLSSDKAFVEFVKNSTELKTYLSHSWSGFSTALPVIASITSSDFEVKIIDENFEQVNFDEHYDLVGVTAVTQQATRAYQIMSEFRKRGVKVVMGGIHATTVFDEAKKYADAVVVGEAENVWAEVLCDFKKNRLKKVYKAKELANITNNPVPRYDLLHFNDYKKVWLQFSRGCPIDCEFCVASKIYGYKYRHKTIPQIINEVLLIQKIWPNIKIGFADDNMFKDKKYSSDLIKEIKKLNIKWDAQTDISIGTDEKLLKQLKEAGCTSLFIGFESVSKENLKTIDKTGWKLRQRDSYDYYINKIQSCGIGVLGAFIVGLDGDDTMVFQKTVDFIVSNNLAGAQITVLTPLPGCRLTERLERENRVLSKSWSDYTGWNVVFTPKKMSPDELRKGVLSVYNQIYSPDYRLKRAKHFKAIYGNLAKEN